MNDAAFDQAWRLYVEQRGGAVTTQEADLERYRRVIELLAERNPSSGEAKTEPTSQVGTKTHTELVNRFFTDRIAATESKAQDIAELAHQGQTDQTGEAYILHPAGVVQQMTQLPQYAALTQEQQEVARQAAWLHDTLEDTAVTHQDLRDAGFDDEVIATIDAVTGRAGEAKTDYYERVKAAGPVAVTVKLGDLTHNNLPERRANLPGSPTRPVRDGEEDRYTKLGKKYWIAYTALGSTVPLHLQQFAPEN